MGFFDNLLKGMGFDTGEDTTPKNSNRPFKKSKRQPFENEDKYNLINSILPEFDGKSTSPMQSGSFATGETAAAGDVSLAKNVIVYSPKNQGDVKKLVDFLRRKEPIIVNFEQLDNQIAPAMVSFISGSLYALKGSIHPIGSGLYLLTPEGVSILVPKERRRPQDELPE